MARMTDNARQAFTLALATVQAKFIKGEARTGALELARRDKIGGSRLHSLARWLFSASAGRCVCCVQRVELNVNASDANAATIGILIPCAMVGGTERRGGYLPGNAAMFCRSCVDASNGGNDGMALWIWAADCIDADRVPLLWPSLPKMKVSQVPNSLSEVELVEYAKRAAIVRTKRGLIR